MNQHRLTERERAKLHKGGTIYVRRGSRRIRVDAGDGGELRFDLRYRTLAAALLADLVAYPTGRWTTGGGR